MEGLSIDEVKKAAVKTGLKSALVDAMSKSAFLKKVKKELSKSKKAVAAKESEAEAKTKLEDAKAKVDEPAKALEADALLEAEVGQKAPEEKEAGSKLVTGQKVKLAVEDLIFKLRLGETATVEQVMGLTARVLFETALVATDVPTELLEPGPWKASKPLRTFARVSHSDKQVLLMSLGIDGSGHALLEKLPAKGDGIFDESVDVYGAMVSWSFPGNGFSYVPLSLSRCVLRNHGFDQGGMPEMPPELAAKQLRALRQLLNGAKVVTLPVYAAEHFATLILRQNEHGETIAAEYRDSLKPQKAATREAAEKLVSILGLEDKVALSTVWSAPQAGTNCGLHVCHYVEDEARFCNGEGHGSQGWPGTTRVAAIREYVRRCTDVLNTAAEKWASDEKTAATKRLAEEKQLRLKALEFLKKKGLLEQLAKKQKELADVLLSIGESADPVPLPPGFGEKKHEPKHKGSTKPPLEVVAVGEKASEEPLPEVPAVGEEAVEEPLPEAPAVEEKAVDEQPPLPPPVEEEAVEEPPHEVPAVEEKTGEKHAEVLLAEDKTVKKDEGIEVEFAIENFTIDDLAPQHQAAYLKVVEEGVGVCSKCRWRSGCLRCEPVKAWRYYVRLSLGLSAEDVKAAKKKPVKGGGFEACSCGSSPR